MDEGVGLVLFEHWCVLDHIHWEVHFAGLIFSCALGRNVFPYYGGLLELVVFYRFMLLLMQNRPDENMQRSVGSSPFEKISATVVQRHVHLSFQDCHSYPFGTTTFILPLFSAHSGL